MTPHERSQLFVGSLFAPRWTESDSALDWSRVPGVSFAEHEGVGWSRYILVSREPITSHERDLPDHRGLHVYPILFRVSGPRFLLACQSSEVFDHVLSISRLRGQVATPYVDVARLVADLSERPEGYTMSAVFARLDGFGQSLKSMVLYGSDLADARLFRQVLPSMAPYRVTLRDPGSREDVCTVGSKGDLSFIFRGTECLSRIDSLLRFLSVRKYVDWAIEGEAGV